MKKDVIYIDIEDDITAIIGKVKDAEAKIVALVPPKRIGVLQSAVNLKLLQKSAVATGKRVVLITNDNSLTSLAAGVKMPVAKNLQSRPEIPQIAALQVDDEDIINGEELPVGDMAAAAGMVQEGGESAGAQPAAKTAPAGESSAADEISQKVDLNTVSGAPSATGGAAAGAAGKKPLASQKDKPAGKKVKIPDFDRFRKKLFIAGGLLLVLVPLLVWALVYAPKARVVITATTTDVNIDRNLALLPALPQSNVNELQFKPVSQELKKPVSVDFTPTGTKDIGERASGTVTVSNASESDAIVMEAGTQFVAAGGQKFVSTGRVTVPGAKVSGGSIKPGVANASVQAATIGPEYNIAAQDYTIQGYSSLDAQGQAMSGGSRQTVKVVTEQDVQDARDKLGQQDDKAAQSELQSKFTKEFAPIPASFTATPGSPTPTPAVGEQADKAKLTLETTYTMLGLPRAELKQVITKATDDALRGKADQAVYTSGESNLRFEQFQRFDNGTYGVRLLATAAIGPRFNTEELARQLTGKRAGEIQQEVEAISGVERVTVNFSPFWVNKAPGDAKKIDIKFSLDKEQ